MAVVTTQGGTIFVAGAFRPPFSLQRVRSEYPY
jgi:hypothetical protein